MRSIGAICLALIVAATYVSRAGAQSSPSAYVVSVLPTEIDGMLGGKLRTVFLARYRAEGRCGIRVWSSIEMPPTGKGFVRSQTLYLVRGEALPGAFWYGAQTGAITQQRSLLWNLKTTDPASLEMIVRSGDAYDPLSPALLAFGNTGFILGFANRARANAALQRLHAATEACQERKPTPSPTPS